MRKRAFKLHEFARFFTLLLSKLGCSITRYRSEIVIRKVETRFSSLGLVVTATVLLNLTISGSPLVLLGSGEYCDDVCIPCACIQPWV